MFVQQISTTIVYAVHGRAISSSSEESIGQLFACEVGDGIGWLQLAQMHSGACKVLWLLMAISVRLHRPGIMHSPTNSEGDVQPWTVPGRSASKQFDK